jgi:hypothetical protein
LQKINDEITKFQDARYISAAEACWRMYNFAMNSQTPRTERLPVHIENGQTITFKDDDKLQEIVNKSVETQLTQYLQLNKEQNAIAKDLYYHEIPQYFAWKEKTKKWSERVKVDNTIVGRMNFVHPTDIERFYLRTLLLYTKNKSSFEDLRTVTNIKYPTFREAAIALGLAKSDNEWHSCLEEASFTAKPFQLRELYVLILINCFPANPRDLWDSFKDSMTEDIRFQIRNQKHDDHIPYDERIIFHLITSMKF